MDAELARRLGTLQTAELSKILDFMQTFQVDGRRIVNEKLTVFSEAIDATAKEKPRNQ